MGRPPTDPRRALQPEGPGAPDSSHPATGFEQPQQITHELRASRGRTAHRVPDTNDGIDETSRQGRLRHPSTLPDRYLEFSITCPFPGNIGGLPQHLERLRFFPERAAEVLMLEHSALALNPNSRLFGTTTLHSHVVADRNTDTLTAFRHAQSAGTWSVYRVQRIIWALDERSKGRPGAVCALRAWPGRGPRR